MRTQRFIRILAGALLWLCGIWITGKGLLAYREPSADRKPLAGKEPPAAPGASASTLERLYGYFAQKGDSLIVRFPGAVPVEVGDEVHLDIPEGVGPGSRDTVIGEVEALLGAGDAPLPELYGPCSGVRVRIFDNSRVVLHADSTARLVRVPQTASWVAQTLLTRENIERMAEEWNRVMVAHRDEIFALVTPIVRDVILDVERHIQRELPQFLAKHRTEVQALNDQLRESFLEKEFTDFFETELWPIAEPRVEPVIRKIGEEIWRQLPIWGFSWRLAYQSLPFTSNDHVKKAWRKFRDEKVLPILRSHSREIIDAAREIAQEVFSRKEVSSHLRRTFENLITTPRFHSLAQAFLREVFLDNPRFNEVMKRRWRSPRVQHALEVATGHIEPAVRRMGDIVLGTRKDGITREFARVLRAQILLKDLQHVVIHPGSAVEPPLPSGAPIPASILWEVRRGGDG